MTLAMRRWSLLTSASGTPNTSAACSVDVAVLGKGLQEAASSDRCAMMRSSICDNRPTPAHAGGAMKASRMRVPRRCARDVLQVGIGTRQPPGYRGRLRIARVQAAGLRMHHLRQLVGVGGFQLGHAAVVENRSRDGWSSASCSSVSSSVDGAPPGFS